MSGDDIADPELLARIAAWFGDGEPVVSASCAPPPAPDPRLAEIEASLDPLLVDRLERWTHGGDALLTFTANPLGSAIDESLALFAIAAAASPPDEEREYWQPDDIREALDEHNTPQAVLRDLFRPIMYFGDIELRPVETGLERLGVDPTAAVRQAVSEPLSAALGPLPPEIIASDRAELREIMARPWQDSKPDTPSQPSAVPDMDHYMWFGVEGGYDPDV